MFKVILAGLAVCSTTAVQLSPRSPTQMAEASGGQSFDEAFRYLDTSKDGKIGPFELLTGLLRRRTEVVIAALPEFDQGEAKAVAARILPSREELAGIGEFVASFEKDGDMALSRGEAEALWNAPETQEFLKELHTA